MPSFYNVVGRIALGRVGKGWISRIARPAFSAFLCLVITLSSVAPSYAWVVESSFEDPALGALAVAPSVVTELPAEGAAEAVIPANLPFVEAAPDPAIPSEHVDGTQDADTVEPDANMQSQQAAAAAEDPDTDDGASQPQGALNKYAPPETPYNGAFTRSLPVDVPQFHGITPQIALTYSSSSAKENNADGFGAVGAGWHVTGGSVIELKSQFGGAPGFKIGDIYSLDGNDLAPCANTAVPNYPDYSTVPSCASGGNYFARFEAFERIKRVSTSTEISWIITSGDGVVRTYRPIGVWNAASTEDPRLVQKFRWLLATVEDPDGNTVTYSYGCATLPTCYVTKLAFGATAISMTYENREDINSFATGISLGSIAKRLKTIQVRNGGVLARAYDLDYTYSPDTDRSLLASVQQYGTDAVIAATGITGGTALPADTFVYSTMADRRIGTVISDLPTPNANAEVPPSTTQTEPPADLRLQPSKFTASWKVGNFDRNNKTDFVTSCKLFANGSNENGTPISDPNGLSVLDDPCNGIGYVGDFNGDGYDDFANRTYVARLNATYEAQTVAQGYRTDDVVIVVQLQKNGAIIGSYYLPVGPVGASGEGIGFEDRIPQRRVPDMLVGDFNGDGLDDIFSGKVFISSGGTLIRQAWANATWGRTADVNGDGLDDIFRIDRDESKLMISTGAGFTVSTTGVPTDATDNDGIFGASIARIVGPADLNDDGSDDFLKISGTGLLLAQLISTGNGFVSHSVSGTVDRWQGKVGAEATVADVNGDGKVEIIYASGIESGQTVPDYTDVYNVGPTGLSIAYSKYQDIDADYRPGAIFNRFGNFGDYNGDGKVDPVGSFAAAPTYCTTCRPVFFDSWVPDLLKGHNLSLGGQVDVNYLPSTYWSNGYMPFVLNTVTKVTVSDGRGGVSTTKYSYSGGAYDVAEKRFLGFQKVTAELPCEAYESSCPWIVATFRQEAEAAGSLSTLDVYASNATLLRHVGYGYSFNEELAVPKMAFKVAQQTTDYFAAGTVVTRQEWSYDGYGNVTQHRELGVTGDTTDDLLTKYTYSINLTPFLTAYPVKITQTASGGTILRDTNFYYDGGTVYPTAPVEGHVTRTDKLLLPGNRRISDTFTYDTYGNQISHTDPRGAQTKWAFDATFHQFPILETSPLEVMEELVQHRNFAWDTVCAQQSSSTDWNLQATTYSYDVLCRKSETLYPNGSYERQVYSGLGSPTTQYVETRTSPPLGEPNFVWTRNLLDGLGRTYQVRRPSTTGSVLYTSDVVFGKRGAVYKSAAPYYVSGGAYYTTYRYDAVGRQILQIFADNASVTTSYDTPASAIGAVKISVTDPLGHIRRTVKDSWGRDLVRASYPNASTTLNETFDYDAVGQLVGITDPGGSKWVFGYDTLGRRTSSNDPDLGTWTYAYDDAGNLVRQVDAKAQVSAFTYDVLGRMLTKTIGQGLASQEVTTFIYDQPRTNYFNNGYLTTAVNPAATETIDYTIDGLVTRDLLTVAGSGMTFAKVTNYDNGRVSVKTYTGAGNSGAFRSNAAGQLDYIAGVISNITYTASGDIASVTYASGVVATYTYDPERGWLTGIASANGTVGIQAITYTRDAAGRITSVNGARGIEDVTYTYDNADRLLSATYPSATTYTQAFTYSGSGNILTATGIGTYAYPAATSPRPHAMTSAGTYTFTYDANGNQVQKLNSGTLQRTIVYDPENRPSKVTVGTNVTTYAYGPDGTRVKKVVNGAISYYFGADYERDPAGGVTAYYHPNFKRLGASTNSIILRDALGSVHRVLDAAGVLLRAWGYKAYGTEVESAYVATSPGESKGFIDQRYDAESGLTYLNARYYDPAFGRFIQPDWWDASDPAVGTNRYSYSLNDPINASDPTGHCLDKTGFSHCIAGLIRSIFGQNNSTEDAITTTLSKGGSLTPQQALSTAIQGTASGLAVTSLVVASVVLDQSGVNSTVGFAVDPTAGGAVEVAALAALHAQIAVGGGGWKSGEAAFYRGAKPGEAPSFAPKISDIKIDPMTGLVKDTHGVSVFDNQASVSSKGFVPFQVNIDSMPAELRIIQRGGDPHHYEIVPMKGANLTFEQFSSACSSIVCVR